MRFSTGRVLPLVLVVLLAVLSAIPAIAQDVVASNSTAALEGDGNVDGTALTQAEQEIEIAKFRAKLAVDCRHRKSKKSDNNKVRKYCERRGNGLNNDSVTGEGANQQSFNCGFIEFQVSDAGGGTAQMSFFGESSLGVILGGVWGIDWTNRNTGAFGTPNGLIGPMAANPRVFSDSRNVPTGRGRVTASLTGNVITTQAFCFILPPLTVEESVLR